MTVFLSDFKQAPQFIFMPCLETKQKEEKRKEKLVVQNIKLL